MPSAEFNAKNGDVDGALLSSAMKKGQMFGVDVLYDVDFDIEIAQEKFNQKSLWLRFESGELPNPWKDGVTWSIADIDNYFTDKVREEEEM
jgi:hypothetical protein